MNPKRLAAAALASIACLAVVSCPQPLELRGYVERRVVEVNTPEAPAIAVSLGDTAIPNGGTIDIGSAAALATKDVEFAIGNAGDAALSLSGTPIVAITGADQAEFSIQASPATPIAPGGESSFTLRFSPTAAGAKAAILTITNNTPSAPTFSLTVTAAATAAPSPAIQVAQGSAAVAAGSTVDLGHAVAGTSADTPFTISNSGDAALILSSAPGIAGTNATEFSVQALSATTIAAGSSATFSIRFSPFSAGAKSATVAIASNGAAFSFGLSAVGDPPDTQGPTGSVTVSGGAAYSQSLSVTLALSAADVGGGTVTQMEVRNDSAFTGNWQSYATSLPWTLAGPDGTNTVYARFRDNFGNNSGTYSDAIILDRVDPAITLRSPASAAANVGRTGNIVVTFSENMDQSTMTAASVSLRIKGGATIAAAMSKAATTVTLNPASDLLYGYDYSISVTNAVKDLSGRSISNPGSTDFTVERDYWEGAAGNDLPANAYDLTAMLGYNVDGFWFDFIPDLQEEGWSLPAGVHSNLARLGDTDYYMIEIPDTGLQFFSLDVFFTTDEASGLTVDTSGSDVIRAYVTHDPGTGSAQVLPSSTVVNQPYRKSYEYDISGESGPYYVMIYENSYNYAGNRRYNLRWRYEPGI
jgi:hypothetical protein